MVQNNKLIVKSNYIVEASYKLTLGEQRVIYVLTSMIKLDDKEFKSYKLTVKEFAEILGTKSKDMYSQVALYVEGLRDRDLTIVKEKSILKTKWLSSAEYFIDEGFVELCFDPKLKPYLLMLKERFTKLSLEQMVSFSSQYSGRIYELLKQYDKIGERTFKLEELRILLGINYKEYVQYGLFKQRILNKVKEEINSDSDLLIDFEEIKTGRRVTSVKFYIKQNKAKNEIAATVLENPKDMKLIKQVQTIFHNHNITEQEASCILKDAKNKIDLIRQCYNYSLDKNVPNIIGYMRTLVKGFNKPQSNVKAGGFNDYEQRTYDFDKLERQLLGWENKEDNNKEEYVQEIISI